MKNTTNPRPRFVVNHSFFVVDGGAMPRPRRSPFAQLVVLWCFCGATHPENIGVFGHYHNTTKPHPISLTFFRMNYITYIRTNNSIGIQCGFVVTPYNSKTKEAA